MLIEKPLLKVNKCDEASTGRIVDEARQGRCLLLSTGAARQSSTAMALMAQLAPAPCTELNADPEESPGLSLDGVPEDTLRWIEAARLYEALLRELSSGNRFRFIFCLDPWTAGFLSPAIELCPGAKWVYVEGAVSRDQSDHERQVEEWLTSLPFDFRVSAALFDRLPLGFDKATSAAEEDRAAYRSVFANPGERLLVVLAGSVEYGGTIFQASAELSNVRWLILGANPPSFAENARGIHILGDLPASVHRGILEVADACIVLSGPALDSLAHVLPGQLPILAPKHLEEKAEAAHRRVRLFEGDSAQSLTCALTQTLALSRSHERKTAPILDFVLYNDWGIGDELLLSAVAREILRDRRDVRLWIRSRHGFRFPSYIESGEAPANATRVEVIYQNAALYGPQHHSPYPGHLVQQMLDKFALDTGIAVQAKDPRPEVILAKGEARRSRSVVLHSRPNPRLPSKDWGVERWTALSEALHVAGVQVLQVGARDEPLLPHVEDHRGMPIGDVPDLVARAGAVVCLVGFLMHAAAASKTPTVVIYGGREHPAIDGYPDQVHLSSEPLPCRGRWGCHLAPDSTCPHRLRCMDGITPQSVASEVLLLLDSQMSGPHS